jgi:hypothetical protein
MELLVYEGPDGSEVFDPSVDEIIARLYSQGGEGAIRAARRPGDERPSNLRVTWPDGSRIEYLSGFPQLWIEMPEPGQFYFTWSSGAEWVPYDCSGCAAYLMSERSGNPFRLHLRAWSTTPLPQKLSGSFWRRSVAQRWSRGH